jgi:hypothetical protein
MVARMTVEIVSLDEFLPSYLRGVAQSGEESIGYSGTRIAGFNQVYSDWHSLQGEKLSIDGRTRVDSTLKIVRDRLEQIRKPVEQKQNSLAETWQQLATEKNFPYPAKLDIGNVDHWGLDLAIPDEVSVDGVLWRGECKSAGDDKWLGEYPEGIEKYLKTSMKCGFAVPLEKNTVLAAIADTSTAINSASRRRRRINL